MSNKKLSAIITIGGAVAGSLRTAISGTTTQLGKIGSEIQRVKKSQVMLGESIRTFGGMGKNVDNLRARYSKVTEELNRLTKTQEKLNRIEELRQKNASVRSTAGSVLGGAVAASAAMIVPVKLAIDFESAMADVKKVFSGTDSQFKSINTEILKMSTTLPMAAKDIANIVASGAQSGIAAGELTKFAETAVKMGVAFDIGAEESGQAMAEMRTAFKMSQSEVTTLADKINFLGNTTPAAAKGIMEIVQRIGPLGEVGGFASGSIAALGATIRGMGVAEEVAATGIKNMMLALVAGESATKSQKAVYKELGLDSEKIAKGMQVNAEATTLNVLKQISKLDKYRQGSMLKELFGSESLGSIAPLLTNMDALEKNLNGVSQANKKAWDGSMQSEYEARANTTANKLQLLKNNAAGLGITIGTVLLPVVSSAAESMSQVIGSVTSWAQANPQLASTLTKVAVGAIAVVGGIAAVALAVTTIIGPIALAVSSFSVLGASSGVAITMLGKMIAPIKMIGTVFGIVGKAMLANPMVLAIVAIVAVVAGAAYLIYKNWEPIKAFFSDLWSSVQSTISSAWGGIKSTLSGAWDGITGVFNTGVNFIKSVIKSIDEVFANNPILNLLVPIIGIPRLIIANWSTISSFFSQLWATISSYFMVGVNTIKTYFVNGFNAVYGVVSNVWTSITSFIGSAFTAVSGVISAGMTAIGSFMSSAWSGIKSIVSTAWTGLCTLFLTITPLGYIVQNFDAIKLFLSNLAGSFMTIGKNIIDGLISGILSGFEKLKSVWKSINSYMPDFMKKKMDIHSPSRVMAGLGGFIVDGIGVGMEKRTPALRQQFGGVLNSFNQAPPAPSLRSAAIQPNSARALGSDGGSSSGLAPNITITIHAAQGQSADEIANMVMQKLNRAKGIAQRGSMVDWGYAQ
ncbi:phage tail tape measure protein [Acinetobacter sp. YH01020]|uniref:phage tail tape measure protein n=1 Tax=Acinetobacter sp. YH01020 TaxID=2601034 RepID=UPI0015D35D39|nr:phage tail tape measure protein [Acinetobacter sp. YH01020]